MHRAATAGTLAAWVFTSGGAGASEHTVDMRCMGGRPRKRPSRAVMAPEPTGVNMVVTVGISGPGTDEHICALPHDADSSGC